LLCLACVAMAQAPVPVAEEPMHRLKFENELVRVFDVLVPGKQATLFHVHNDDYVFVAIGDAFLKSEPKGGRPGEMTLAAGQVRFAKAPITHRITNLLDSDFRQIAIELRATGVTPAWKVRPEQISGYQFAFENDRVYIERLLLKP